jgi:DNA repair protein RadC
MVRASEAELLALILAAGRPGQAHHSHAIRLLARPDGLRNLFRNLNERTLNVRDADDIGLIGLAAAMELHRRWRWAQLSPGVTLSSPNATANYLQSWIGDRGREIFAVIFLDTRHRVICSEELFLGTIDGAQVHPH